MQLSMLVEEVFSVAKPGQAEHSSLKAISFEYLPKGHA
jgi:hypothetical protein